MVLICIVASTISETAIAVQSSTVGDSQKGRSWMQSFQIYIKSIAAVFRKGSNMGLKD